MKVHLLSSNHDSAQENKWDMPFDPSLREVTVSLSGPAPQIELSDPFGTLSSDALLISSIFCGLNKGKHILYVYVNFLGRVVGEKQGLKELLNIPNSARVINLKFPRPGSWKLKVNNESLSFFDYSIAVN